MTTQPTLLDYPSEQGDKSRREDGLGDPHGATITPTSSPKPPQDTIKIARISVPKDKTINHTPEGRRTQNKRKPVEMISASRAASLKFDNKEKKHIEAIVSDHPKGVEPRPHPIMSDPDFQKRYQKFLKKEGLEYGTSDPAKRKKWNDFWTSELRRYHGGME